MSSRPVYEPIDRHSNSIRLLRLLKGAKHYEDDPIRCELFEAPLPTDEYDESYYDALSYTWGGASETGTIVMDGLSVTVTKNLRQALRYLRLTDEDRILWIDAICINQSDHSERTHQVSKMGDIYKKSREVIIWLGTATKDVELLLDAAKTIDKRMLGIPKPPGNDPNYLKVLLSTARTIMTEMGLENNQLRQMRARGLEDMLSRAWWSRIWVIQEAANAPRARVQCSWHWVSTRMFALMPQLLGIAVEPHSQVLLEVMPGPLRRYSWWHKDRNLETLLVKFQFSKSTEECDQIYALLGMSTEAGTSVCPLEADYSLDITRVVQNTISFLAFGELSDLETCSLPAWSLSQLRNFMSSLKPSLLAWALIENQPNLIRKLLLGKPPQVAVNDRLPNDVNMSLPPRLRYLLPPPIHLAMSSEQHSASLMELLLECEELDVNVPGFKPLEHEPTKAQIDLTISYVADEYTPLSLAASMGRMDLVHLLSKHRFIRLNQKDPEGFSPIERALENSEIGVAKALISLDEGILKDEGWRFLHQAIQRNHVDMVRTLLSCQDVEVNRFENGFNPLGLAASLDRDEIISILFSRKDLRIGDVDPAGFSPLERAFQGSNDMATALLLARGGRSLVQNEEGHFLRLAIYKNWPGIVKTLLAQGVSPDSRRSTRTAKIRISPLALASGFANGFCRHISIIRALLEARANPDPAPPELDWTVDKHEGDAKVWHPMVRAIRYGSLELLETLMSTGRGAQKTAWNTSDEPLLVHAIRRRHAGMVKLLLSRGADSTARTARRKLSSFWLAVEYKAPKIMRLLADAGADFTICAGSHPNIYQGEWGLKFMPWYDEFLKERGLSAEDVWRIGEEVEVMYDDAPIQWWWWNHIAEAKAELTE